MKIRQAASEDKPTVAENRHAFDRVHDENDMTEMLNELRVLLPGAQLLTGFLITLPFNSGFRQIVQVEKWVFMAAFLCSLTSLVLFTAPAVQHRMLRPLNNRMHFKNVASRQMLAGASFLSLALVLCANLVTSEVIGHPLGGAVAAAVTSLILSIWWIYPWWMRLVRKSACSPERRGARNDKAFAHLVSREEK